MCITDGILRARLDGELTKRESLEVDDHLTGCANCKGRLEAMAGRAERLQSLFCALSPQPDELPSNSRFALSRFKAMHEPVKEQSAAKRPAAFLKRIFTASISVPIPIAAAFVIAFSVLFQIAIRVQEPLILQSVRSSGLPEPPKIVEIPVIREKIVTHTIYIEDNDKKDRKTRSFIVQNLTGSRADHEHTDLSGAQITGKEFERMLRKNERSLLERRTLYLKPSFGDPSIFRDVIPPVIWQRDMFDMDYLAKPVNKTRLIANQPAINNGLFPGIDFTRAKPE